jgi:hypothetical protein
MDRAVPGQPERRAREGLKSARSAVGTHRFRSSGSIAVSLVRRSGEALPVGWTKEGIPRRREYDRSFLNRQTRGHVSARAGSMPERWSHLYHAGGLLSISNLRGLEAGTAAKRSPGDGGSQLPPRDETSKPNGVDCFVSLRPPRNDKEEGAAGVGPPGRGVRPGTEGPQTKVNRNRLTPWRLRPYTARTNRTPLGRGGLTPGCEGRSRGSRCPQESRGSPALSRNCRGSHQPSAS